MICPWTAPSATATTWAIDSASTIGSSTGTVGRPPTEVGAGTAGGSMASLPALSSPPSAAIAWPTDLKEHSSTCREARYTLLAAATATATLHQKIFFIYS